MKRIIIILAFALSVLGANAQQFSAQPLSCLPGESVNLSLAIDNEGQEVTSFQFDMQLPIGITAGQPTLKASFNSSHTLSTAAQPDGSMRVLVYSQSNALISWQNVLTIPIAVADNKLPGDYNIVLSNAVMGLKDGSAKKIENCAVSIVINKYTQSISWNQNLSEIDEGDIITLDATASSGLNVAYRVVLGEEIVTVSGASLRAIKPGRAIIEATQSGNGYYSGAAAVRKEVTVVEKIPEYIFKAEDVEVEPGGSVEYGVAVSNSLTFTSMQFDMTLPEGITATDLKLSSRLKNHQIAVSEITPGTTRVLIYSLSNFNAEGDKGDVVNMTLSAADNMERKDYKMTFTNIIIVNNTGRSYPQSSVQATIILPPVLSESVTLNYTEYSLVIDDTLQLTATVLPEETGDKTVVWGSSNPDVATVDSNGLVKAKAYGEATITASNAPSSAECVISVDKKSQEIVWEQTFEEVSVGSEITLNAFATSGLPVEYAVTKGGVSVSIAGEKLTILSDREIEVTAMQNGNEVYKSAAPISKSMFAVSALNSIINDAASVDVYSITGILIHQKANLTEIKALTPGVYLFNNRKVIIR